MAPTTFAVTGTFTKPDGTAATGRVDFTPIPAKSVNTATIQDQLTQGFPLSAGAISISLVQNATGYTVKEYIDGVSSPVTYTIPGGPSAVDLSNYSTTPTAATAGAASGYDSFGPFGILVPRSQIVRPAGGRLEGFTYYNRTQTPTGEKPIVAFEARGYPGILNEIFMVMNGDTINALEELGRIRVYLDNEDTPSVDLSVNDFFMYAEHVQSWGNEMVGTWATSGGDGAGNFTPITQAAYEGGNLVRRVRRTVFMPWQSYIRIEYVDRHTSGAGLWWVTASGVELNAPFGGSQQSYKVITNDTLESTLLSPPTVHRDGSGTYTPVVGTNPSDIPVQQELLLADITGPGQLESLWIALNTADASYQEGNVEIWVDGVLALCGTGMEDFFEGEFGQAEVGRLPAGSSLTTTVNVNGAEAKTWYKFFFRERVTWTTHLQVFVNMGQKSEGVPIGSTYKISAFLGYWPGTAPVTVYRTVPGAFVAGGSPAFADEFVGGAALLTTGPRVPSDGLQTPSAGWSALNVGASLDGSGKALTLAGSDVTSNFQLPVSFGTDYFLEASGFILERSFAAGASLTQSATSLTVPGGAYAALGSPVIPRVVTDGVVTSGSKQVTSATAAFVAGDVGRPIAGPGIPVGAVIKQVTNGSTIQMGDNGNNDLLAVASVNPSRLTVSPLRIQIDREIMWVTGMGGAGASPWTIRRNRVVTDAAVTNGAPGLTSATASFVADDAGNRITGNGIPADTIIKSVTNGTTIVMSNNANATLSNVTICINNVSVGEGLNIAESHLNGATVWESGCEAYFGGPSAALAPTTTYPEAMLQARQSASGGGLGSCLTIEFKRISNFDWTVVARDGFDTVGVARLDNGLNLQGVSVQVGLLVRGTKAAAFFKTSQDLRWRSLCSWTVNNGAAANRYVGIGGWGNNVGTKWDYIRVRSLS